MVSSYTAGSGENDVIEIHQFSSADIDAYLDIYFDTLDNRLRHYIGQDEQLRQFRVAMKNRISKYQQCEIKENIVFFLFSSGSNPNAREYQNVLLGKMNGEVLAAVTMSFPGETPTIPLTSETPEQNSCLTAIHRWMARKSNYIPTNTEECYIEMLGVKSDYQNHGIGSAMLECVEHFARQAGAKLLTIHINGQRLRNYFERYGFHLDQTDSSAFWKWIVERQSSTKLSKPLLPDEENNDFTNGSYINESMVGSVEE
jgi:N-acetylglutamate synthase-like GNAT family acetyltransferase